MFCPQCEAEYIDGITECADCHVPLVERLGEEGGKERIPAAEPDFSHDDLFPIMIFLDREEAIIAQGFLESNGVAAVLSSDETMRARRGVSSPQGIRLLIKPGDKKKAEEIFKLAGIYPEDRPYRYEREIPEMSDEIDWKKFIANILLVVSILIIIIAVVKYVLE